MIDIAQARLIRALQRKPVDRTPVWMMRQAGRYLPEYRETRAKAGDFLTLCKTPELACEVTLQPLRRYPLDAAILFSDILTIPDALGLGLSFVEGEGPCFERPLRSEEAIYALPEIGMLSELAYVTDAVRLIRREMPANLPLIGFSGSPWTLACYMVEGKSSRDYAHLVRWAYTNPSVIHMLLAKLAGYVSAYLIEQVAAGANVLMVFDTWGGILTTPQFEAFSLHYMTQIVQSVKERYPDIPILLFTKGGGQWLSAMADSGCDGLSVDWTCDLTAARAAVGHRVALQGNLDPTVLLTSVSCIQDAVRDVLAAYGKGTGHVFNLGHGITPNVPPEHVTAMIEAIHMLSPKYHICD